MPQVKTWAPQTTQQKSCVLESAANLALEHGSAVFVPPLAILEAATEQPVRAAGETKGGMCQAPEGESWLRASIDTRPLPMIIAYQTTPAV